MKRFLFILLSLVFSFSSYCNEIEKTVVQDDIETYKKQASQLISFLEFTLNTLGSAKSTQKEKETIINESFLKIFVDEKVQVEDDLDENRTVPTNKNIQAYLKDIDFFFKEAEFKFTIEEVTPQLNDQNRLFFKFQINRNLKAILISGDTLDTNKQRFIEVNFNEQRQDLKIASIYTTKLNEKEELKNWWNSLSESWKLILAKDRMINDSVRLANVKNYTDSTFIQVFDTTLISEIDTFLAFSKDTIFFNDYDTTKRVIYDTTRFNADIIYNYLKEIIDIQSLEIPDTLGIKNLDPLSKLSQLRSLVAANIDIKSLMPLRNLTALENLDCHNTFIDNLEPLKYTTHLKSLNIDDTEVSDLSPLSQFLLLERLYFSNTLIDNIQVLSSLDKLQDLRFINTQVKDIDPIKNLFNLVVLNFSNNQIKSLEALSNIENLKILVVDNTQIHNLSPLENNKNLIKIYCDHTNIIAEEANRYMRINSNCLVIYNTDELINWWSNLNISWKNVFRNYKTLDSTPTKEQLHDLIKLKDINISENAAINSLEPLRKFIYLKRLDCSYTKVNSLEPLRYIIDLNYLNCNNTKVENLDPLKNLTKLRTIYLSNTSIKSLQALKNHKQLVELRIENTQIASLKDLSRLFLLEKVYADNTKITLEEASKLIESNSRCMVIHRSSELKNWWQTLNRSWQEIFLKAKQLNKTSITIEELHEISYLEKINLNNVSGIRSLSPLTTLGNLKELRFTGTQIVSLSPLRKIKSLETIECGNNPITDLSPIMYLPNLKYLDISNIPIENFDQIQFMKNLETLICPGIQIKSLKDIEPLTKLKHLEIYNTKVRNLRPLDNLKLEHLKCYNTGLNDKKVMKFKETHPKCEVVFY